MKISILSPIGKGNLITLMVGKEGFEPSRLAALDSKSRLSASSSTSP
jgi:hypothetical protein